MNEIEEAIMIMNNERPSCVEKLIFTEEEKYEAYTLAIEALQKQEPRKPIDLEESIDKICVKYICPGCRKKKYKVRGEERYCQSANSALTGRKTASE